MTPLHVFSDFDGTITTPDTLMFLTERLGAGLAHYRETGRLLDDGTLNLREAVARDIGTLRAPFAEAAELLRAHVAVDEAFVPFARWCAENDIPLTILSGGFEEIVDVLLGPTGAPLHEVRANRFRPGTWECCFRDDSPHGHDKAAAVERARAAGRRTIMIGDGISDREPAAVADVVFARRGRDLADWCRRRGIACQEYDGFHDVQRGVARLTAAG